MITYLKAANAGPADRFGGSVTLSADGSTLAVGAIYEGSSNGGTNDCDKPFAKQLNCLPTSGAAYVFQRQANNNWAQQAFLKAANAGPSDYFGWSVALSADGSTLAVGEIYEDSVNDGQVDDCSKPLAERLNCQIDSGAAYMY